MFTALVLVCAAPVPKAATPPVVGKGFAAAPVATDLQRKLANWGRVEPAVVVFYDAASQFPNPPAFDPEALDWAKLKTALAGYKPAKDAGVLFMGHAYTSVEFPRSGDRVFQLALKGVAQETGYGRPVVIQTAHAEKFDWAAFVAPLEKPAAAADEPAVGDADARGYAVRTPLSRALLGPKVYALVDVLTELDPAKEWAAAEKAAGRALAGLKLPAGSGVRFHFRVTERSDAMRKRLQTLARTIAASANCTDAGITY